jgi:pimeloyl-ACP methyl ester carboxylesterase
MRWDQEQQRRHEGRLRNILEKESDVEGPTTRSSVAQVNGIELGYQIFGDGAPLILLHGGFGSVEMFGPNVELLAAHRQVIGVDLQSHGRSPAADRLMRFETMADDIVALIDQLGLGRAAVMGFSLGGGVALRTAIQRPTLVERLVLVSTVFERRGWYSEMTAGMDAIGPEMAANLRRTPLFQTYERVAPNVNDWPVLVQQLSQLMKLDYGWSAEIPNLPMPVMLVAGDADGMPPSHAVEFFALLGGGQRDGKWDRSGITQHRLAILAGATHYDINSNRRSPPLSFRSSRTAKARWRARCQTRDLAVPLRPPPRETVPALTCSSAFGVLPPPRSRRSKYRRGSHTATAATGRRHDLGEAWKSRLDAADPREPTRCAAWNRGLSSQRTCAALGRSAGSRRKRSARRAACPEISLLERAGRDPRLVTITKLAKALGVTVADLVAGI